MRIWFKFPVSVVLATIALFASASSVSALPGVANGNAITSSPKLSAVVTISAQGGFVGPNTLKTRLPETVAYSDGTVLRGDVASFRSDIMALSKRTVSIGWLKSQAAIIAKLSKTPKGGWGTPGVADVPDTRIRINLGKTQVNIGVYALWFTNGNLTSAQVKARKALAKAIDTFQNTIDKKAPKIWAPSKYEVWAGGELVSGGGLGIANPASVFCTSMGGGLSVETTPEGERGLCVFGEQKFDEWEYYRTQGALLSPWPAELDNLKSECTVVTASALKKSFAVNNETGIWLLPTGQAIRLTFRPVLLGESPCKR